MQKILRQDLNKEYFCFLYVYKKTLDYGEEEL